MIKEALAFLVDEVNKYLSQKLGQDTESRLILGNVVKVIDNDAGAAGTTATNKAILSLVNIEEDRFSKSPDNFRKVDDKIQYKNPKIFLNLYLLFAVNKSDYSEALKLLAFIIQFFQYRFVFDIQNSPNLDPKIEKIIMDLYSLNFEQMNHLWGILGGKYLPSVLYKMRVIGIEDETADASAEPIMEIEINPLTLSPQ